MQLVFQLVKKLLIVYKKFQVISRSLSYPKIKPISLWQITVNTKHKSETEVHIHSVLHTLLATYRIENKKKTFPTYY